MKIGYACLAIGVEGTSFSTCQLKNLTEPRLQEAIVHNLRSLENLLDYNLANHLLLFRLSSDLIPFGSSPVNTLPWWDLYRETWERLAAKIRDSKMRVSMHPGQYTVLNSPDPEVVRHAQADLRYHERVLDCLHTTASSKIVLHVGGVYGAKTEALERFLRAYQETDPKVRQRLVLENDDRSYDISEVLTLGKKLGAPVVFDNLHHLLHPSPILHSDAEWIALASTTWKKEDGTQIIHYSQPDPSKRRGAHSQSVALDPFLAFVAGLKRSDIDIMLEVKDKNLSALKCLNALSPAKDIVALEKEWGRYKYAVLAHSASSYGKIRELLKDKAAYPVLAFYRLVETALASPVLLSGGVNAAAHVWGYFKKEATPQEREAFAKKLEAYAKGQGSLSAVKNLLRALSQRYGERYLLSSLYFDL